MSIRYTLAALAGLGFCALSTTALPVSLTTLHTFSSAFEGNSTQGELTQGTNGGFYGTNSSNGPDGNGSVYGINDDGSGFFSVSFGSISGGGIQPIGGVVQASDGNFYGTTYLGGANALGTFFRFTPDGSLTTLAFFNSGDPGSKPAGTLTQGLDGFLYGTAQLGGVDNYGTVFRASAVDGSVAMLSSFAAGADGLYPESDLTQASDGNFYGTTTRGGFADAGTIFRVTPTGIRTVIYDFSGDADGRNPLRGVVLGRDGLLYGLTVSAGANNGGTVYRVNPAGGLTVLYSFSPQSGSPYTPYGRLVQASDGNFYGTTNLGGGFNAGTIFGITPNGVFSPIYSFTNTVDGGYPSAGLVQGADGKLYGTTAGLNGQDGTIFQLDLGLPLPTPQPVLFAPVTVNAGDTITIKGDYFLGVTGVTFPSATGSTVPAASFAVFSKTILQAVVPVGAVSGAVTVSKGTLLAATPAVLTVNATTTTPTGGDNGLPEVSITAPDPVAAEPGGDIGKFKIKRTGGDLTQPLTVLLKIKGSATRGVDYYLSVGGALLPTNISSVTIPANKGGVAVKVQVLDDTLVESDESVIVKVKPGTGYTVGTLDKAQVVITDDD